MKEITRQVRQHARDLNCDAKSDAPKAMLNRFQLQDSSNIDAYGQNLVGQVFFEQRVCYLVVEIALKSKDAFLLK